MSVSAPTARRPGFWRRDLLLLALIFGALYFFRLGSYPLSNPDEGRNAEVPREMLVTGEWVTPRLDGVVYFEKPPLMYWVTAVFERTFGLNEWAVRAVPALFAIIGILLTYAAARGLYDRTTGWLSAVILGTSVLWFVIGHIPILDIAVSVFMAATLFCFLLAVREPPGSRRRWFFMGLYASAALATLTKGLMGFLVTGAVMFLWLLIFKQWKRLRPMYLPSGVALFLVIALPWHVLAALRNPNWFHRYIIYEHFLRFLTPVASRPGPWHYFIWVVIGGLIPWTGFAAVGARDAVRGGWGRRQENVDGWFLLTWAGFIFLFFSASHSKLAPYILPIFPALAVLAGRWIARALALADAPTAAANRPNPGPLAGGTGAAATIAAAPGAATELTATDERARTARGLRLAFGVFSFLCGLLALALVVVIVRPALVKMDPTQALALRPAAIVLALTLLAGSVLAPRLALRRSLRAGIVAMALMMGVFYGALEFAAPHLSKPGTKELALYLKAHARPGDQIFTCYDFYQDLTFYSQHLVGVVGSNHAELELDEDAPARASGRFISQAQLRREWTGPGRIFLVVQKQKLQQVRQGYADAMAKWHRAVAEARKPGGKPAGPEPACPVFADPSFKYHVLDQTSDFLLVSNQR